MTYHYDRNDRRAVTFAIDQASFDALPNGSMVKVGLGLQRGMRWDAGPLHKSLLEHRAAADYLPPGRAAL